MGKLLDYIAKETRGECFASFKYCYPEYRVRGGRLLPVYDKLLKLWLQRRG